MVIRQVELPRCGLARFPHRGAASARFVVKVDIVNPALDIPDIAGLVSNGCFHNAVGESAGYSSVTKQLLKSYLKSYRPHAALASSGV